MDVKITLKETHLTACERPRNVDNAKDRPSGDVFDLGNDTQRGTVRWIDRLHEITDPHASTRLERARRMT